MQISLNNGFNCGRFPLIKFAVIALIVLIITIDIDHVSARPSELDSIKMFMRHTRIPEARKSTSRNSKSLPSPYLKMRKTPPTEMIALETSNQVLECEAYGSPAPTIHWLKDGKRIIQNEGLNDDEEKVKKSAHSLSFTRSRLFLDCVNPKDAGRYTCVASSPYSRLTADNQLKVIPNEASTELINDAENSVALCLAKKSFGSPARIIMWTHNRLEMIGTDVQLYCRSSGVPTPTTKWYGPDEEVISNSSKYQILDNGDLVIKNLSWDDMGNYYCSSENLHGNDSTSMFLYPTSPESE